MKYIEWIMLTIQVVAVAVICFAVFGCAGVDQHQYERDKAESQFRKNGSDDTNRPAPGYGGDIGMPQEWLDQWPSTRQVNEQIENSIIGVHQ